MSSGNQLLPQTQQYGMQPTPTRMPGDIGALTAVGVGVTGITVIVLLLTRNLAYLPGLGIAVSLFVATALRYHHWAADQNLRRDIIWRQTTDAVPSKQIDANVEMHRTTVDGDVRKTGMETGRDIEVARLTQEGETTRTDLRTQADIAMAAAQIQAQADKDAREHLNLTELEKLRHQLQIDRDRAQQALDIGKAQALDPVRMRQDLAKMQADGNSLLMAFLSSKEPSVLAMVDQVRQATIAAQAVTSALLPTLSASTPPTPLQVQQYRSANDMWADVLLMIFKSLMK